MLLLLFPSKGSAAAALDGREYCKCILYVKDFVFVRMRMLYMPVQGWSRGAACVCFCLLQYARVPSIQGSVYL